MIPGTVTSYLRKLLIEMTRITANHGRWPKARLIGLLWVKKKTTDEPIWLVTLDKESCDNMGMV